MRMLPTENDAVAYEACNDCVSPEKSRIYRFWPMTDSAKVVSSAGSGPLAISGSSSTR